MHILEARVPFLVPFVVKRLNHVAKKTWAFLHTEELFLITKDSATILMSINRKLFTD